MMTAFNVRHENSDLRPRKLRPQKLRPRKLRPRKLRPLEIKNKKIDLNSSQFLSRNHLKCFMVTQCS